MHLRARWNRRGGIFAIGSAVLLIAATVPAWSQPGTNLPGLGASLAAQIDADPTVSIEATDADASEPGTNTGTFTVTRTGDMTQALEVSFDVTGSAGEGLDFVALSSPATIAAGNATTTLTVTPLDDSTDEADETVTVTLTGAAGYVVGTPAEATVTIADDDLPVVSVTASDTSASEDGGDPGEFTVTRDGLTTGPLTVDYSVSGSADNGTDYSTLSGSVEIASGETSATIAVAPLADDIDEAPETVILTLSTDPDYEVGSPAQATVTIADDDLPTVTVVASDSKADEDNLEPGAFTVTRTGDTSRALTVDYSVSGTATAGSDYKALSGSVEIAEDESTAEIVVTPLDDSIEEFDETVVLTITSRSRYTVGSPRSATVTIEDDELPRVTVTASDSKADEDNLEPGAFTVSRTGDTSRALTVDYSVSGTATAGSDYTALSGSVEIAAGKSTAEIVVTPLDDSIEEGDETVVLTITSRSRYTVGSPRSATVTIEDDETVTPDEDMPSSKDECKKGGWMDFGVFKNQGDCVSWVATGGKNPPALAGSDGDSSDSATTAPAPRPHPGKGKGKKK